MDRFVMGPSSHRSIPGAHRHGSRKPGIIRPETDHSFRDDIVGGLASGHRRVPSKHLYDRRGAELFERICELPEYYPTRTELGIMRDRLGEIAKAVGRGARVVEYGSGASTKTRMLLAELDEPAVYHPVDISRRQLEETAALDRVPGLGVSPCHGDFNARLVLDEAIAAGGRTVAYLVRRWAPGGCDALLQQTRELVGDDPAF